MASLRRSTHSGNFGYLSVQHFRRGNADHLLVGAPAHALARSIRNSRSIPLRAAAEAASKCARALPAMPQRSFNSPKAA